MVRILIVLMVVLASCQVNYQAKYREKTYPKHDKKSTTYFVHEHVFVTMKDGRELECIVRGRISKRAYYVQQYRSRKRGRVHEKYMRPISEEEMATLEEAE